MAKTTKNLGTERVNQDINANIKSNDTNWCKIIYHCQDFHELMHISAMYLASIELQRTTESALAYKDIKVNVRY